MRKQIGLLLLAGIFSGCATSAAEHNNNAIAQAELGEYDAAIQSYQSAQVIEPENALLYFNASGAYANAERIEEAQSALEQAIQRGDDELAAAAYFNLGNIALEAGDSEVAIDYYQQALLLNPDLDEARYNLEYALGFRISPTPTPMEMQTNLDEQGADTEATPTPNPAGQTEPTPTPTPPETLPDPGPSPMFEGEDDEGNENSPSEEEIVEEDKEGELDVETAAEILEPVDASQERISTFREDYNVNPTPEGARDW